MSHIWTDIHQMGDTVAALAFGVTLEEFANLEEKHHENGLRKFVLGTRKEADAESSDGGNRHEEMFIERIATGDTFPSLMQCLVAY